MRGIFTKYVPAAACAALLLSGSAAYADVSAADGVSCDMAACESESSVSVGGFDRVALEERDVAKGASAQVAGSSAEANAPADDTADVETPDFEPGWNFADGMWYYADVSGELHSGWLWWDGSWWWLDPATNAMAVDAWVDDAGGRYYLAGDGRMATGWFFAGTDWYLADDSGRLVEGWATVDGSSYWLDPEKNGSLAVGPFEVDGKRYCAIRGGAVAYADWALADGVWYYADASGELHSGWLWWGGSWWWLDPETNAMATGLIEQDGVRYYLDESGTMVTGAFLLDGVLRFADAAGAVFFEAAGWQVLDGESYYVGEGGILATGWFEDAGRLYYFDGSGVMSTGWLQYGGSWYLLGYDGAAASGWHQVSGIWYWLDEETYAMATGWVDLDGTWYYFDGSGAMATGWIFYAGSWYCCRDDGSMATGWQYIAGSWYWFDENGVMVSGGWVQFDDGWYWFYDSGAMATGWINVAGTAYKLDSGGRWVEDTGKVLGVSRSRLVNWLLSHRYDGYYLGTPYSSGFSIDTCMYPSGAPRWDGFAGMNCTGFVAQAYASVGGVGELGAIGNTQSHSPWLGGPGGGSYINAWRWYGYAIEHGAEMYAFDSVASMLASGKADKGDIVFFKTNGSIDCHIGFFWGDTPDENCMWHQISPYNCISTCFNNANKDELYQQTVLIKGF